MEDVTNSFPDHHWLSNEFYFGTLVKHGHKSVRRTTGEKLESGREPKEPNLGSPAAWPVL